jgi:hypothetical protein
MSKQNQEGGNHSINIQAESLTLKTGLTYKDVREIAIDVFKQNFYQLVGVAKETAAQRAEEITDKFLKTLQERNPEGIRSAEDPDFQYALFTAQREYARAGDTDLADILVDILVERSKESARSLQGIVLNESLNVAPKLTPDQIAVLSIVFTLRYSKYLRMYSIPALKDYIKTRISPFINDLPNKESAYQHLEFIGCCSIQITEISIERIFHLRYPGLFSNGFTLETLKEKIGDNQYPGELVTPCLQDSKMLQINAIDEESFHKLATEKGVGDDITTKFLELHKKSMMNETKVKEYLESLDPAMRDLVKRWNDSSLKHITLTSVGIAIGHANVRRVTGEGAPLSIWI